VGDIQSRKIASFYWRLQRLLELKTDDHSSKNGQWLPAVYWRTDEHDNK